MKTKIYVGIRSDKSSTGTPGTRVVFRNVLEPTPETHPQYSAVIGPFRTVRGARFMAQFGANNPHCQTVADAERIAKDYVPSVSEQTVYVASAWWSDCNAFVTVCGNSPKHVEKAIYRAMRDAAIDAYNSAEPEDKRKVRDYLDEIGWSGVNAFQFDAIISQHTIDRYEPGFSGGQETVVHDSDMDYFDYEALRRGDKDAIVYLPTA